MVQVPDAELEGDQFCECRIGDFLMFTDMLKNISGPRDADVE